MSYRNAAFDQLPTDLMRSIDSLARQAERCLRGGDEVRIEELLEQVGPAGRANLLEELLLLEVEHCRRRGQELSAADWLERFPDDGSIIQRVLESYGSSSDAAVAHQRFLRSPATPFKSGSGAGRLVWFTWHCMNNCSVW